ncbi:hypothetical protein ANN_02523 [Periplaneta americana]|uniref:Secreted protein n=1 Tax=Periplaneta americana TaxID=6978 RepID=A0ABQ8TZS5_PERAM|nr:hypothetical protein ANN_02523 [Periplaneta americana]
MWVNCAFLTLQFGVGLASLFCARVEFAARFSQSRFGLANRWRSVRSVYYHNLFRTVFCAGKSYAGYLLSSVAYGKSRRVQGLVIVLAKGRRHVKKLSVRETSEQRQRNYHLPETISERKHVLHPSTA